MAAWWTEYKITLQQYVFSIAQSGGANTPRFVIPALPPARPGRRWEAQIEGFLRLRVTKPGTVYVSIAVGGVGNVSGGKQFTAPGEDLIPIMQRTFVSGGEEIVFSIYTAADGGDTVTVVPNPYPYLLLREVKA